ncbi:cell division protein FtsQ/DivIB [Streptococcus sp. sy004]|uniref:cell division protein FtsQ/DivIB n=1 Tax=Streptococcus sp. sy004 TaxID=2600149 RepID=UPI0011B378D4|nr:FtsQ-type POTRA domain-containing protein [Streptococcus sp. sy004]TWT12186.1 FtsQ-type POTRA domain-containing protein [Streptococcus sp. sy004]
MSKKNKHDQATPERELSDWQKRNIEFLKKKQQEEQMKAKAAKGLLAKRKSLMNQPASEEKPAGQLKPKKKIKKVSQQTIKKERTTFIKVVPIIVTAMLVLLASVFYLTPYSQQKVLQVIGVDQTTAQDVNQASGIKESDYLTSVFLKTKIYEKAITKNNPWVKETKISYQFPNIFNIKVKEYQIYAYGLTEEGYRPILESGTRVDTTDAGALTGEALIVELTDKKQIKQLVAELLKVDQQIVSQVRNVSLTPSKATADLLQLEMYDGNLVRVPLSELSKKLSYYNKMIQLTDVGIIDMEVGIYRTTSELEAQSQSRQEENTSASESSIFSDETESSDASEMSSEVSVEIAISEIEENLSAE